MDGGDSADGINPNITLYLDINRLSGVIPAALRGIPIIALVKGNMFICDAHKHSVPVHDAYKEAYTCGSDPVNVGLLVWTVCWSVLVTVLVWTWYVDKRMKTNTYHNVIAKESRENLQEGDDSSRIRTSPLVTNMSVQHFARVQGLLSLFFTSSTSISTVPTIAKNDQNSLREPLLMDMHADEVINTTQDIESVENPVLGHPAASTSSSTSASYTTKAPFLRQDAWPHIRRHLLIYRQDLHLFLFSLTIATCSVAVVLIPLYYLLTKHYRVYQSQYLWTFSACYLSGWEPVAGMMVVLVAALGSVKEVSAYLLRRRKREKARERRGIVRKEYKQQANAGDIVGKTVENTHANADAMHFSVVTAPNEQSTGAPITVAEDNGNNHQQADRDEQNQRINQPISISSTAANSHTPLSTSPSGHTTAEHNTIARYFIQTSLILFNLILVIVINGLYVYCTLRQLSVYNLALATLSLSLFKIAWGFVIVHTLERVAQRCLRVWQVYRALVRAYRQQQQAQQEPPQVDDDDREYSRDTNDIDPRDTSVQESLALNDALFGHRIPSTASSTTSSTVPTNTPVNTPATAQPIFSMYILSSLLLFNNIVAPFCAEVLINPNCFYYFFFSAAPVVNSTYPVKEPCYQLDPSIPCVSSFLHNIAFHAPFTYTYLCSSSVITSFSVVFLLRYILSGVLGPLTGVGFVQGCTQRHGVVRKFYGQRSGN